MTGEWRCGAGGDVPCGTFLPRRGLCDRHRAAILVAAVRARVDSNPRIVELWRERALALDPTRAADLAPPAIVPKPEPRAAHHAKVRAAADARREQYAARIAAHVREHDGPATRQALAKLLGVANSSALGDAIKLAHENGSIHYVGKGAPKRLIGAYRDLSAFEAAREAASVSA